MTPKEQPAANDALIDVLNRLVGIQEAQPIPQQSVLQVKPVSPWNPEGKRDHERPKLSRNTYMNGFQLHESRMTEEEIHLANQLKAGKYQNRKWAVITQDGEDGNAMFLYVPNKTLGQRMDMPRSFAEICRLILDEAKAASK